VGENQHDSDAWRAIRGQRLIAKVPHGHWKTTIFLAALRTRGLRAPLVVDGAINGAVFLAYVEQQLAPTLTAGEKATSVLGSEHRMSSSCMADDVK